MKELGIALRTTLVTLVLTGVVYPLSITALAQLLLPWQANGSLERDEQGRVVGSRWIGQRFRSGGYFHSRPSSAGSEGHDATASGGSNLGPTSMKLRERTRAEVQRLRVLAGTSDPIPSDLVTASASGLDPHLSPRAVSWQVARVAAARGVEAARIEGLVREHTEGRDLGFLGEPRVHVLRLNLALDRLLGTPARGSRAALP
jgi:potassium-transporting ATPase KdpC subunit